ncbi:hypothetical protein ACFTAO_49480 [Paenibacillus rhizoplanae]
MAVTGITAANGMVEVVFNRNLDSIPDAADFAVLEQVNHGEFHKVEVTLVTLLDNKATVQLTIPSIAISEAEQLAVYSLSYKGGSPVLSEAITVPKANVTVTGRLFAQPYTENKPLPAYNLHIYLRGVKDTRATYTAIVGKGGEFAFDNVMPGTYVVLIPISPYTYFTEEFTVLAGKKIWFCRTSQLYRSCLKLRLSQLLIQICLILAAVSKVWVCLSVLRSSWRTGSNFTPLPVNTIRSLTLIYITIIRICI